MHQSTSKQPGFYANSGSGEKSRSKKKLKKKKTDISRDG